MFFHPLLRLSAAWHNAMAMFALSCKSGAWRAAALDDATDRTAPTPLACGTAVFSVYRNEAEARRRNRQIAGVKIECHALVGRP
jgi:hypothetical protein